MRKDGHKGYVRLTDRIIGKKMLGQGPGGKLIPLFGNSFDQSDVDGAARGLESHLVGPGAKAQELERRVARFLGFEYLARGKEEHEGPAAPRVDELALGAVGAEETADELVGVEERVKHAGEGVSTSRRRRRPAGSRCPERPALDGECGRPRQTGP